MAAKRSHLALFAARTFRRQHNIVLHHFNGFVLFALTRFGYDMLGKFDEVAFPAYGEDVEYHLRAVSLGLGSHDGPWQRFWEGESRYHWSAPNLGANPVLRTMIHRWDRGEYRTKKWGPGSMGFTDYAMAHPYAHPFNNPRIWHQHSWVVDPVHRNCIRSGPGNCRYNEALTKSLERASSPPERPYRGSWTLLCPEDGTFSLQETSLVRLVVRSVVEETAERPDAFQCRSVRPSTPGPVVTQLVRCEVQYGRGNTSVEVFSRGHRVTLDERVLSVETVIRWVFDTFVSQYFTAGGPYSCTVKQFQERDPFPGRVKQWEVNGP